MSWETRRQAASFRGVPFFVEVAEDSGGRRTAAHEFPNRDGAYTEDLGLQPAEFGLDAYVVGDDYDVELARLEQACLTAGPGLLVHPRRGRLQVVCLGFRLRDSDRDGGMGAVSLTFREDQPAASPLAVADPAAAALEVASSARAETLEQFLGSLKLVQVAGFARAAVDQGFGKVLDALEQVGVVRSLGSGTNFAGKLDQLAAILGASLGSLGGGSSNPSGSAAAVDEVLEELPSAFSSDTDALDALKGLIEVEPPVIGGSSAQALTAQANAQAPVDLLRVLALSKALELAAEADWATEAQAQLWRACLAELIDGLLTTAPDVDFERLRQLRAALVASVPPRLRRLPQVARFTPPATVPAAVVQYELAGGVDELDDLVTRNALPHPLFAAGGEPLDYLVPVTDL